MGKEYGPAHTTQQERFGGFALAHFGLSGLGCFLYWPCLLGVEDLSISLLIALVFLLAYFPLGMASAWMGNWTFPLTGKECWQAVGYPTAVAWAWVGIVILSLFSGDLLTLVFITSLMLAAPSSGFVLVIVALMDGWSGGLSELLVALVSAGLLAGVLPPLLFAWGSFCQAEWANRRTLWGVQPALHRE